MHARLAADPREGAEVIGAALLAKTQGAGHRTIAARLDRPAGTVRGWPRASCPPH
ncbi:MAG: hypothetical protein ACLP22_18335 [Solirubrobacteraceae bacterium]